MHLARAIEDLERLEGSVLDGVAGVVDGESGCPRRADDRGRKIIDFAAFAGGGADDLHAVDGDEVQLGGEAEPPSLEVVGGEEGERCLRVRAALVHVVTKSLGRAEERGQLVAVGK